MGAIIAMFSILEEERKRKEEEEQPRTLYPTYSNQLGLSTHSNFCLTTSTYGPCQKDQYAQNGVGQACHCQQCSLSWQYGGNL